MTESDLKTGRELLKEAFIQKNPEWTKVSYAPHVGWWHAATGAVCTVVVRARGHHYRCAAGSQQELELMIKTKEKAEIRACRAADARLRGGGSTGRAPLLTARYPRWLLPWVVAVEQRR